MNAHTIRDRDGNAKTREFDGKVTRSSDQPGAVGRHIDSYTRPYRFAEEYQPVHDSVAQARLDLVVKLAVFCGGATLAMIVGGIIWRALA